MDIITNNVPRDVIGAWELSPKERAGFDDGERCIVGRYCC